MAHTVLQVPVPVLEPFVRARHAHYDADYVSTDPRFGHAHVTVLGPFVTYPTPEDLAVVAAIAATTPPFDFTLARVQAFPDGIVHALPDPPEPFRTLTERLHAAFPDHPPYGGQHDVVVPHLTLDALSSRVTLESTRAALGAVLPATCRAEQLHLAWWQPGGCRLLAAWALRSSGPAGAAGRVTPPSPAPTPAPGPASSPGR